MSRSLGTLTLDLIAKIAGFTGPMDKAARNAKKTGKEINDTFEGIGKAAKKAAAIAGIALGGAAIVSYSNEWTDLNSRVKLATGSQEAAIEAMQRIGSTARNTYSGLKQTAEIYLGNSTALNELGYSTLQQLDYTEALNNALVVGATKGQQAESVLQALSKAMALGSLQGDNLNTVIQSGGRVAQALADGMGVTTLELRKLGKEGKITGDIIFNSVTGELVKLREEAASMPATMADAKTLMGNSLMQLVGSLDTATQSSATLSAGIISVADSISSLATEIIAMTQSGQLDAYLAAWGDQFTYFSQDAERAILIVSDLMAAFEKDVGVKSGGIKEFFKGAFIDFPANVRAAIQIATVEIAAFADKAEHYGLKITSFLNPVEFAKNQIRGLVGSNDDLLSIESINSAREASIATILAERDAALASAREQISLGKSLREEWENRESVLSSTGRTAVKVLGEETAETKKAAAALKAFTSTFQSLADRLDPSTAALNKYNKEQDILFQALGKGIIDLQRYDQLMSTLDNDFYDSLLLDVDAIGKGVKEVESIYTGMWERIGEAGADVFLGIMNNADDAFSGIADLFKRTLAEMANEALINPIVLNFKESFSGSGSSSGEDGKNASSAIGAGGIWAAVAVAVVAGVNEHNKNEASKYEHLAAEIRQGVQSTGTLLGMANAKSDSIANVLGDMDSKYSDVLSVNHGMYRALIDIRAGLAGVASGFARSFSMMEGLPVATGSTLAASRGPLTAAGIRDGLGIKLDPISAPFTNFVLDLGNGLSNKIAKEISKKKVSILDSGIQIIGAGLADILAQGTLEAFSYADVQTTKKTFGITTSNKVKTQTEALGDLFQSQLAGVFENAADALKISSGTYGIDFNQFINQLVVDPIKLSLKDLEGDAITEEIERFLSSTMDGWAGVLLGGTDVLDRYQQVGEGAFETMVRLSSQTEQFNQQLSFVGLELGLTGVAAVKAVQDIAGLAGGFDTLSGSLSVYYDKFFTDAEKFENLTSQLVTATGGMLDSLPETTTQFRDIISAIDKTTEAGQKQFAALINLSGPMYEYIKGLEDQRSALTDFMTGYEDQIANFGLSEFEQQMRSLGAAFNDAIAQAQSLGASEQQLSAIRAASQMDVVRLLSTQTDNSMSRLNDSIAAQIGTIQQDAAARIAALQSDANSRVAGANSWMQSQLNHYQRQIGLVGESINQLTGLSDAIKSAIDAINPVTEISRLINYGSAVDRLSALTSTALAGNGLPTADIINQLSGAMQGNSQYYSSYEDWIVATAGITANLDALAGVTETQLTADEKMLASLEASMAQAERHNSAVVGSINSGIESQIAAINAQMEADIAAMEKQRTEAEEQIAAMRGIDTSVLSVEEAVKQLSAAMQSESQNRLQQEAQMNAELLQELRNMNRSNGALANQVERLEIHLRNAS